MILPFFSCHIDGSKGAQCNVSSLVCKVKPLLNVLDYQKPRYRYHIRLSTGLSYVFISIRMLNSISRNTLGIGNFAFPMNLASLPTTVVSQVREVRCVCVLLVAYPY